MRFKFNPYALVLISTFLMSCSGGKGSFDLEDVQPRKLDEKPKTVYQDEETQKKEQEKLGELLEPALGYVAKVPVNALGIRSTEISEIKPITDEDLSYIPNEKELNAVAYENYGWVVTKPNDKTMNFVRSGYVVDVEHYGTRDKGYVYYKGINPSKELPQGVVVIYQGEWDFTSDANLDANRPNHNPEFYGYGVGKQSGVTSADAKQRIYNSKFEVDFSAKKLHGQLNTKNKVNDEDKLRYEITADISGNRFRGKAIAADKEDHILGKDSDNLEGGFYGSKAEEMTGKFITNDKSLFAVFSGKRSNETVETTRIIDASKIDLTNFEALDLNSFGNASVLILDGRKIELTDSSSDFKNKQSVDVNGKTIVTVTCCSNLEYMKFGQIWQEEDDQKTTGNSLFLQGERTQTEKMPTNNSYKYIGTWDALVSKETNWIAEADNNRNSGYRAEFDVNFGDKKIDGKLFDKGGINPAFTLDAKIHDNGFNGYVKTSATGIQLDLGSTRYENAIFDNIDVKGGFYGPNAGELGGQFHHKSEYGSVGAVFGAKRQIEK